MRLRRLGAQVQEDGVHFRVWAPLAEKVEVLIPHPVTMQVEERGYHAVFIKDLQAGARYMFRLDGQGEWPDLASRFQPEGVHGPSEVVDRVFSWSANQWRGVSLEELVIYELHVGTFTEEGTFAAIVPHLARLSDLGINAIEIMPIAQFPGVRNWGYDGVGIFAPQNSYGGNEASPLALKKLIDACHQIGIAVILDVVYNHFGPEGNYFSKWGPYFQEKYKTPWGSAINFDGAGSDEVRAYFLENARQWVDEYRVDGLRLDAVHAIFDTSAMPFLGQLTDLVHELGRQAGRQVHVIAESESNDSRILKRTKEGGLGIDAQWADDLHHVIHTLLTQEKQGYYADYGKPQHLAQVFRNGVLFQGEYSQHRQRCHGGSYKNIARHRLVVCTQNHDQIGNRAQGERLNTLTTKEKLKAGIAWCFLSGGLPLIFMGEEIAETAPFLYFVNHADSDLLRAVIEGRRKEFAQFAWGSEVPDPTAPETFSRSRPQWQRATSDADSREMQIYYKELIRLSKWIRKEKFFESGFLKVQALDDYAILHVQAPSLCASGTLHLYFSLSESIQEISARGQIEFASFAFDGKKLNPFGVVVMRDSE